MINQIASFFKLVISLLDREPLISSQDYSLKVFMICMLIVAASPITAFAGANQESPPPEMAGGPELGPFHLPDQPPGWAGILKGLSPLQLALLIFSIILGFLFIVGVVLYVTRPGTTQDHDQRDPERGRVWGQEIPEHVPQHKVHPSSTLVCHPNGMIELAVPVPSALN